MHKRTLLVAVLMVGPGGLFSARPATAQTLPLRVALSGTAAPAGGNYSSFNNPVLNESGQVAFFAALTGGSSSQGIFLGLPGSVQTAVRNNTAAPAGGNYSNLFDPVLNGAGQVAFRATLTGGSSPEGIFVGAPGAVQAAALRGTPAPAGGNYFGFYAADPVLNGSGQVAFHAELIGGGAFDGLFVGAPGSVQAAALAGNAAPAGGNYSGFTSGVGLNGSGQVAFHANLTGGSPTKGVFVGAPGAIQTVALNNTAAPAGGNYSGFYFQNLNGSGYVALYAFLTAGSSNWGIFAGTPGAIQAVALQGAAAPAGGNYSSINVAVLNGSGQVAFTADLTGGSSTQGVFFGVPGAVQAVALENTAAPAGGNYSSFTFYNPVLNGSGQVAFLANLTGTSVTTANDQGLYAGSLGGLVKVVREGDQVDVDPGPGINLRTIADGGIGFTTGSSGQDGRAMTFSDSGLLTYRLTFTDGSSGIFVSSIAPVPEPTSAALMTTAGLAMLRWLKRRSGRRIVLEK